MKNGEEEVVVIILKSSNWIYKKHKNFNISMMLPLSLIIKWNQMCSLKLKLTDKLIWNFI